MGVAFTEQEITREPAVRHQGPPFLCVQNYGCPQGAGAEDSEVPHLTRQAQIGGRGGVGNRERDINLIAAIGEDVSDYLEREKVDVVGVLNRLRYRVQEYCLLVVDVVVSMPEIDA